MNQEKNKTKKKRHTDAFFFLSLDAMQRSAFLGHVFDAMVRTDGVQVHFVFTRIKARSQPPQIKEQDVANRVAIEHTSVGIDPGRRTIITASYQAPEDDNGDATGPSPIRRVGLKEWQVVAGEKAREDQYRRRLRAAGRLDHEIPEHRTAINETFHEYITHRLANEADDTTFFFADDHAAARFEARKGKQRAVDHAANVITFGGRKFSERGRRHTKRNRKQRHFRAMRKRRLRLMAAHDANAATQAHHDQLDSVIQGLDAYVQLLHSMDPNPTISGIIQHTHRQRQDLQDIQREDQGTIAARIAQATQPSS